MLSRESDELLAGVLGGSLDLALVANFDVVYWVCGYVCIVCLLSRESTELYVVQVSSFEIGMSDEIPLQRQIGVRAPFLAYKNIIHFIEFSIYS